MDEERKDEVYLAALAGLLHDVGGSTNEQTDSDADVFEQDGDE
ncbi:MAG TPA: hypothetical protein PLH19_05695 [Anaerolineae bacterium]|nr:hypothetical protein [Anaerolineae bacterium]HQH38015.1 hypothetical protein [Anaerolineae bacterium]